MFVSHVSFAYLITTYNAQAVHRSEECRLRTKLIVFLGTPHCGSTYAAWEEIAGNLAQLALHDSHKKIIGTLEVNSEVLDNIHEEFKSIVHQASIKVHSFQEGRGMSGIKGFDGKVNVKISCYVTPSASRASLMR